MKKLIILFTFIAIFIAGIKLTIQIYLDKKVEISQSQIFVVNKGSSLTALASDLNDQNIVQYPRLFVKIGQLYGYSNKIKYGEYEIEPEDSYREIYRKIVKGENYKYEVAHIEGDHFYKLADQLEAKGLCSRDEFLKLVRDQSLVKKYLKQDHKSLEGYLFPDTYHFSKNDGAKTILETLVKKFFAETSKLNMNGTGLNPHQVVTLASIIEKETGAGFERPLISSVFHNRLKKKMRLQTDPTIIHGILDATGKEIRNIRRKDKFHQSPYNTYVIKGLPPAPIGNPGIDSIKAALNPKSTEFLYFVSQNNGTHIFTKNYGDHLKAVKKYQLDPKARKGKSWRDLKQKKANP